MEKKKTFRSASKAIESANIALDELSAPDFRSHKAFAPGPSRAHRPRLQ